MTLLQETDAGRDAGLVRALGPGALAANIFNIVVGAGIFAVPAALAANLGAYAPLAFLACAAAIGAVAICWAEGGSRVPTSGGAYGYVEAAFGPLAGIIAGTLLWISNVLACGSVVAALADVVASVLPGTIAAPARVAIIIGVIAAIARVNVAGVRRGAALADVAAAIKLVPLLIFVVVGAFFVRSINLVPASTPDTVGLGRALILALFALTGMEAPLSASGEVADPAKTIPRALLMALALVSALYIAIQVVAQGILGATLAASQAPLADAMAAVHPLLRLMMVGGAAISMLGWIGSDILGSPRIIFAFARDGLMPAAFGRLNPRTHTPAVAIAGYAALAIALALSGTFAELAVLSTLGGASVYIMGSVAAWQLSRRGVALAGPPLNFRWLGAAVVVAVSSMGTLIALASREELLGLAAIVVATVIVHFVKRAS